MSIAKIDVQIDEVFVEQRLKELVNEAARTTLLFWDIEEMSKRTCLDKSYLTKHVLIDHRLKVFERRRGKGKRIWLYEGSVQALKDVIDEWY
ncbi:MAG: hypothetical protein RR595_11665 [Lysinibacillus sp.]